MMPVSVKNGISKLNIVVESKRSIFYQNIQD